MASKLFFLFVSLFVLIAIFRAVEMAQQLRAVAGQRTTVWYPAKKL